MATTERQDNDLPRIPQPAVRALASIGCYRLDDLAKVSEQDLRKLHGMGPKAIGILLDALAERGLSFAQDSATS